MIFQSTNHFLSEIEKLTRKPGDGYSSCKADIKAEFNNKPFSTIHEFPTTIFNKNSLRIKKTRVNNSLQNIGKSGSFRVIYITDNRTETVTFLTVYPKTGKFGKSTEKKNEIKAYLNLWKKEVEANTIKAIDFKTF